MYKIRDFNLDDFTRQYLETALWASTVMLPATEDELVDGYMDVSEDHPLHGILQDDPYDRHFDIEDFTDDAIRDAIVDCIRFKAIVNQAGLTERMEYYGDDDENAHNFFLNRNGHGAGFWDGDYDDSSEYGDSVGDLLSDICGQFREVYIWADNDGTLNFEG